MGDFARDDYPEKVLFLKFFIQFCIIAKECRNISIHMTILRAVFRVLRYENFKILNSGF